MKSSLNKYLAYAKELRKQQRQCITLDKFSLRVKHNPELVRLRIDVRTELRTIYEVIRKHFQLPDIPVNFSVRKKLHIVGRAFHINDEPKEIRIYHINGCAIKPHHLCVPSHLSVATEEEVFETLIHEASHVLEVCRYGDSGHEEPFVEAYEDIEMYLKDYGYANLLNPALRLSGVPPESYANQVRLGSYSIPKMHRNYSFSI
jgi:hypothetical protein